MVIRIILRKTHNTCVEKVLEYVFNIIWDFIVYLYLLPLPLPPPQLGADCSYNITNVYIHFFHPKWFINWFFSPYVYGIKHITPSLLYVCAVAKHTNRTVKQHIYVCSIGERKYMLLQPNLRTTSNQIKQTNQQAKETRMHSDESLKIKIRLADAEHLKYIYNLFVCMFGLLLEYLFGRLWSTFFYMTSNLKLWKNIQFARFFFPQYQRPRLGFFYIKECSELLPVLDANSQDAPVSVLQRPWVILTVHIPNWEQF